MSPTTHWPWSTVHASQKLVPVAATLLIALAVASIGLPGVTEPGATPGPSAPPPATSAAAPTQEAQDTAGPSTWSAVQLAPETAVAELSATRSSPAGLAADTDFVLRSLGGATASELARELSVTPTLDLRTVPGPDGQSVTLRPAHVLERGGQYRFELRLADGSLAGSWAFQAQRPPRVVTTLPGDGATNVPTDTGIEITFDQDGVGDPQPYFSIAPAVHGTFERHGRTFVFAPDRLAPMTVYTVTLRRGVPLTGSGFALEQDVRVQFETGAGGATPPTRVMLTIGRLAIEASPRDAPVVALDVYAPRGTTAPTRLGVSVHRLPTLETALAALAQLRAAPAWAQWRTTPVVPTAGLTRVAAFSASIETMEAGGGTFVRLPDRLSAGWYLTTLTGAGRPEQAILQVTDVATYAVESSTRTVVWVNDLARGGPIEDAAVRLQDGTLLGRTNPQGILDVATPAAVLESSRGNWSEAKQDPPALVIEARDGRRAFVPFNLETPSPLYQSDVTGGYWDPVDRYWRLLYTDRTLYRSEDQVNVWGLVRERDTDRAPADAELQLVSAAAGDSGAPPVASVGLDPDAGGSFAATLALKRLPLGSYYLRLLADGLRIASAWVQVGVIRKPAYRLDVITDRRAYVAGDSIKVGVLASFYDGTPVPAVDLRITDSATEQTTKPATTDASGRASATLPAQGPDPAWEQSADTDHWGHDSLSANPARPEEGEISGGTRALVFQAGVYLDGKGSVTGGRVTVRGTLHRVDLAGVERQLAAGAESVDPRGTPVAGGRIQVRVVDLVEVRRLTGHTYDFIDKRVVDLYEYGIQERQVYAGTLTSDATGAYALSVPAPNVGDDYKVYLRASDVQGRVEQVVARAAPARLEQATSYPVLEADASCSWINTSYHIGQAMPLTMRDRGGPMPSGGANRYLFLTAQRGIRDVVVQASARLDTTFTAADAPSLSVLGVRFSGTGYVAARNVYRAVVDTSDLALRIDLSTDARSYRPGETVRIDVRTTDASGRPAPATVTLRAVDEKLFDAGGAVEADPVSDLYRFVDWGVLYSHTSHPLPTPPPASGCGSTAGGRDDFRDTLLFRQVQTDAAGHAQASFSLSDDLTSWHVSASGVSRDLLAGEASVLVPVGLPFFVEASLAPEYLSADRPSIGLRAYGSALKSGAQVTFTVSARSLGLPPTTVMGTAFAQVNVPLPALSSGTHDVTIAGSSGSGATALGDRLTRTFTVVGSRLTRTQTAYSVLQAGSGATGATSPAAGATAREADATASPAAGATASPEAAPSAGAAAAGGAGLTTYTFADAGRGRFVPLLESLAWSGGARLDQALAQAWARDLLVRDFGRDPAGLPPDTFDPARYRRGGGAVSLLPYSSADSALAAELALLAPDRLDADGLRNALDNAFDTTDASQRTREQNAMVLAGRAALGSATLAQVRTALAQPGLTIRERLYLALAAESMGDDPTARAIERALLQVAGERMGAWVRLRVGTTLDDTLEATALLALVAAGLGDPLATQAEAYVEANPPTDELFSLHELAFTERILSRTPGAAAGFAWTVAGARHVVDLAPGRAETLVLTAAQRASLALEALHGSVGVAASWQVPLDPTGVDPDPSLALTRSVSPSGIVSGGSVVQVTLRATFGPQAVDGPYQVTDLLPSGLAPLTRHADWPAPVDPEAATPAPGEMVAWPYAVEAQRVRFSVAPDSTHRSVTMRYLARVVTAGTYAWEPATIQVVAAAESMALTAAGRLEVR